MAKKKQKDVYRPDNSTYEWYTPQWIVDPSTVVLGGIDLDPASSAIANQRIKAKTFFTESDDALSRPWHGSVFLNPPGGSSGRKLPKLFWNKLLLEIDEGNVEHGIYLAYRLEMIRLTQTGSPRSILHYPTCIFKRRVAFVRETGEPLAANMSPSCLVYVPGSRDKTKTFIKEFTPFGVVIG